MLNMKRKKCSLIYSKLEHIHCSKNSFNFFKTKMNDPQKVLQIIIYYSYTLLEIESYLSIEYKSFIQDKCIKICISKNVVATNLFQPKIIPHL